MSSSLNDSVYGMLKFMLSNKIACIFNYKGKNKADAKVNKLSFASTRSCTVMNGKVPLACPLQPRLNLNLAVTCVY